MSATFSLLAGLFLLSVGADRLVQSSSRLALRAGIKPIIVGMTIVGMGTSLPELLVSLQAALAGTSDIALGNVVGSNIANIGLILGLAALIRPLSVDVQVIRREIPILHGITLLLGLVLLDAMLSRTEGLLLLVLLGIYTVVSLRTARGTSSQDNDAVEKGLASPSTSKAKDILVFLVGLGGLLLGAHLFVSGGVALASAWGLSPAVVGLTVVAVGTSLPELATTVMAAWRGASDVAIGNVVGSNIFNILGILGATALVEPLIIRELSYIDNLVMFGFALALLPLLRSGYVLSRIEGGFLLLAYAAYTVFLLV